jgi:hypothetical protein
MEEHKRDVMNYVHCQPLTLTITLSSLSLCSVLLPAQNHFVVVLPPLHRRGEEVHRVLVEKHEKKRPGRRWEDGIGMDLRLVGC